ncbi:MAG: glycoside hydrolase 100 family protein [Candidatus Woesearchaeota archaeon]
MYSSEEIREKALSVAQMCVSEYGFLASSVQKDNYKRVFARDSMILSIAVMHEGEHFLAAFKNSLETLLQKQGPQGEIPSNVDPFNDAVSFGGTAGRVDSNLWLLIGFSQYIKKTNDIFFLKTHFDALKKTYTLLKSWEYNTKGFLYVPQGGDWADEYILEGYVLYDQILYYKALEEYSYLCSLVSVDFNHSRIASLKEKITVNFFPLNEHESSEFVYHKTLFARSHELWNGNHALASIAPGFIGNQFDSFAHGLGFLFGFFEDYKDTIVSFIDTVCVDRVHAFYPVIEKDSLFWHKLSSNYSYAFKNEPYHYHNGGVWPLTMGFLISGLSAIGEDILAQKLFTHLCALLKNSDFNEYYTGDSLIPSGVPFLGFSVAGFLIADRALQGKEVFL